MRPIIYYQDVAAAASVPYQCTCLWSLTAINSAALSYGDPDVWFGSTRASQVLSEPYEYTNSPGVFITGGSASPLASSGHNAAFSDAPTASQTTTTGTHSIPDPRSIFAS